jgi:DNA-binding Lrp family transcriptional regulator
MDKVEIMPRDVMLLDHLYRAVVLSFPQIVRKVFANKAKSTALNRLAKLQAAGLIRRMKVPLGCSDSSLADLRVVFQITRLGIRELAKWKPAKHFREEPIRLHGWSLFHDVLLVDVLDALQEKFPGAKVVDGRLFERGETALGIVPDALLLLPNSEKPVAIELELTAKSERRYAEIMLRYRLARGISNVLYVTRNVEIETKLGRVLDGRLELLGALPSASRFLLEPLHALLGKNINQPMDTKPTTIEENK